MNSTLIIKTPNKKFIIHNSSYQKHFFPFSFNISRKYDVDILKSIQKIDGVFEIECVTWNESFKLRQCKVGSISKNNKGWNVSVDGLDVLLI
jgi:hypothetical protein